ncbi:hypothetical protein Q1695_013256 [Nippostrongylus brasiliensis]|nr:hypothetical protein Q1695_013256 [Nippostrongylus brasiliensis]
MLTIYWLAVVFHLSLAGQRPVRHKVKTTTTTTTTRQSWPSDMPPMDPAARLYTKVNDGLYLEAYVVLDNRKNWYEAQKHCKHYNLELAEIIPDHTPLVREKIRQLTGKMPVLNGVLWIESKLRLG